MYFHQNTSYQTQSFTYHTTQWWNHAIRRRSARDPRLQVSSPLSSPTDPPPPAWTPFISSQLLETPSDNTSKLIIVKTCKMFSHLSYATLSQSASSSRTKPNFRQQHPEVKSENPHLAAERHLTSLKSKQQKIHKVHTLSDHDLAPTLTNPTSHEGGDWLQ